MKCFYKKPAFWIVLLLVVVGAIASIYFLRNPTSDVEKPQTADEPAKIEKPQVEEPEETDKPADGLNEIIISRAATSIFEGPGYDYNYVSTIPSGTYTITEEKQDNEGILWGKLEAYAGWVNIGEATDEAWKKTPITIDFADEQLLNSGKYHEYITDDAKNSEHALKLAFHANETLKNVKFTVRYNSGLEDEVELYTLPELLPGTPLVTGVVFFGDYTVYGISFTDVSGQERQFYAGISGRNGSVYVEEY